MLTPVSSFSLPQEVHVQVYQGTPPPSRELGTPCADAASSSSRACCCIVPSAVRVVMDITDSLGLFPRAGAAWWVVHHGSPNLRRVFSLRRTRSGCARLRAWGTHCRAPTPIRVRSRARGRVPWVVYSWQCPCDLSPPFEHGCSGAALEVRGLLITPVRYLVEPFHARLDPSKAPAASLSSRATSAAVRSEANIFDDSTDADGASGSGRTRAFPSDPTCEARTLTTFCFFCPDHRRGTDGGVSR